jgi:hypothetical protein
MQSIPIATNNKSKNLAHGGVYSVQHYVIQFVSDLIGGGECWWFSVCIPCSATNKTGQLIEAYYITLIADTLWYDIVNMMLT